MVSPIQGGIQRTESRPGRLAASLAATVSLLRGLPLFVSGRPQTPLRVLCLMAFDTVHVLRYSRRLSARSLQTLASLLDFGACANDFFDDNDFSRQEYWTTRRRLEEAGTGVSVNEYLNRLRDLEKRRPSPGGDVQQHRMVQFYRESVVRLSLGMIAATALENATIEDGIRATHRDEDLETLYRIVMLCQIVDDVLDLATDADHGLPSFLTANASLSQALALTSGAATRYADRSGLPSSPQTFPFRMALLGISAIARLVILFGHWRWRWQAIRSRSAWAGGGRSREPSGTWRCRSILCRSARGTDFLNNVPGPVAQEKPDVSGPFPRFMMGPSDGPA
jgi:hypothetical protein